MNKDDIFQQLLHLSDNSLIKIVASKYDQHNELEKEVAETIFKERGFDVVGESEYEQTKAEETQSSGITNFKPLVLAIVLLGFNYFAAGVVYEYTVTGRTNFTGLVTYYLVMTKE